MSQLSFIDVKLDYFEALQVAEQQSRFHGDSFSKLVAKRAISTEHFRGMLLTDADYLVHEYRNYEGGDILNDFENLYNCVRLAKKGRLWFTDSQWEAEAYRRPEIEQRERALRHAERDRQILEQREREQLERLQCRNVREAVERATREYWSGRTRQVGGGGIGDEVSGGVHRGSIDASSEALRYYAQADAEATRFLWEAMQAGPQPTDFRQSESRIHRVGEPRPEIIDQLSYDHEQAARVQQRRRDEATRFETCNYRFVEHPERPDSQYAFRHRDVEMVVGFDGNGQMVDARLADGTPITAQQAAQAWDHLQAECQRRAGALIHQQMARELWRDPPSDEITIADRELLEQLDAAEPAPNALESLLNQSPVAE